MSVSVHPNETKPYFDIRVITPEEAAGYLGRARNNAPMDRRLLASYIRDMSADAWCFNGDPIIFSMDGALLDGRLRLKACCESKRPFSSLVIHNIDPATFLTIDAVRRRTAGDIMHIRGEKDGRALAAALTLIWRAGNGDLDKQSKKQSSNELIEILDKNPTIRRSLAVAKVAAPLLPHGMATALHFLFQNEDRRLADRFFEEFALADETKQGAPYALWRAIDNIRSEGGSRSSRQLIGLVLKAWAAFREQKEVKVIRFVPETESFPETPGLENLIMPDSTVRDGEPTPQEAARVTRKTECPSGIRVEIVDIVPDYAEELLQSNDRNRKIAAAVVNKYVRDMKNNDWALNGQTIKVGASGQLLDGQHRLSASVKSGKAFPAIVVYGLDDEVFGTFDVGNKRSFSHILTDLGETNTALLAGTLRQIWELENELVTTRIAAPSENELLDTLEKHPDARASVRLGNKLRKIGPPSQLCALHYWFAKTNPKKAEHFMDKLVYGDGLHRESPILVLREILKDDKNNLKRRMAISERIALTIKAWNAFVEGRPVKNLKWTSSGARREAFPSIRGISFDGGIDVRKAA
ncbi:hypothetical protein WNY37_08260 [Henriciella sp. AS95]|uniref:hypothetical protein n=1 Tax=Henriciella sp. AS95 TaxID=3135782 RepID=UPI003181ABE5